MLECRVPVVSRCDQTLNSVWSVGRCSVKVNVTLFGDTERLTEYMLSASW